MQTRIGHPRRPRAAPTPARRALGFSMVEVLVAVFVIAVGLLGVARLHATSKRTNLEAVELTNAAVLAQDLLERMRSNPLILGAYTANGGGTTLSGTPAAPATDCEAVECTDAQLAAYDLAVWWQMIAGAAELSGESNVGGLAAPTACVTGPAGGSGNYTVAIAWRGMTPLSDPAGNACGRGSGRYDLTTEDGVQADVYRRVIVVSAHIAEPT
jgi:type IV pilus assembly protein PilV